MLGDCWVLMILRDAFDGLRRFSEFQKNLGLAKTILASRLKWLVESGLLEPLQVRSLDGRMLNPEDCVRKVVRHG